MIIKRQAKFIFLLLAIIGGAGYFWNLSQYNQNIEKITQAAIDQSINETDEVTLRLEQELRMLENLAKNLIEEGFADKAPQSQAAIIRQLLDDYDEIFGIGLILNPEKAAGREDIYVSRRTNDNILLALDTVLYEEEKAWLKAFIQDRKTWSDSLLSKGIDRNPRIQMGILIGPADNPIGAVFLHLSIRELQAILNSAKLGKAGYGFILSESGRFIYHPVNEWVVTGKSIYEIGYTSINQEIRKSLAATKQGQKELLQFSNPLNGLETWYFFEPVDGTNWVVGVTFFKEDMVNNIIDRRKSRIWLSVWFVFFLGASVLTLNAFFNKHINPYLTVVAVSAVFFGGIVYITASSFQQPILKPHDWDPDDIKVTDLAVLGHFKDVQDSLFFKFNESSPTYIKTGIYVEHARFDDAHQVMVSGYVWQEYDLEKHKDISRGFLFPETDPNAEFLDIEEVYHEVIGGREIIGWNFRVSLRKKYNYSNYPFDWQNIRIKIWHQDFYNNVICIPDLESYRLLNPSSLPGIKDKFEMPGWNVKESYFSYKNSRFNTNFGVMPKAGIDSHPELCYNVYIQRVFLSPFVSNGFTISIIIILLFVAQIIELKKSQPGASSKFIVGNLGIIELSAAFFFVLMIAHTSLRESLSLEELIYIDYFYFACYFMILLTCLNFVLSDKDDADVNAKKLISKAWLKIFYWPIFFGIFFIVTALIFY